MFIKMPSILQFREVKRNVEFDTRYRGQNESGEDIFDVTAILPTISYKGTVKLHGTNAAINYTDGQVQFQSRENIVTPEKDNAGFATWGSKLPEEFHNIVRNVYGKNVVVFGEWCGGNIQSGVAISGLPKMFVIFAIQKTWPRLETMEEQWLNIEELAEFDLEQYNIYLSTEFQVYNIAIDFNNPEPALEQINRWTLEVEKECPVGKFFGKSGVGEGIVWVPSISCLKRSRLVLKTKGSEHSKVKNKKLATVNPDKVKSVEAFAEKHVNEERLNQAYAWLAQAGYPQNEKSTGYFVKWVLEDIKKEESDELSFNNLTEKDVNSAASNKARKWFFQKFNR